MNNFPQEIDQDIYDCVVAIVKESGGIKNVQILSRVTHDFGIAGIDAEDLMAALEKKFDIDMANFSLDRHFGPEEPFNPFAWLYWLIFEREKINISGTAWKFVPITVMDLYEAAVTKKFPDLSNRPAE